MSAAQGVLHPKQFPTMSVHAVGKLRSRDYPGMTMGEVAHEDNDYGRWEANNYPGSKYASGEAQEQLNSSAEQHGVREPLEIVGHSMPTVADGHHRYQAAYDTGQSRVPVTGSVKAAKAVAHYTPPGRDY
jgi:hypothetical protein